MPSFRVLSKAEKKKQRKMQAGTPTPSAPVAAPQPQSVQKGVYRSTGVARGCAKSLGKFQIWSTYWINSKTLYSVTGVLA